MAQEAKDTDTAREETKRAPTRELEDGHPSAPLTRGERAGRLVGYWLGMGTGAISFLRHSRTFHPHGILFSAAVTPIGIDPIGTRLAGHAFVRFSSAWWKEKEWIDVLGITIRFTRSEELRTIPSEEDQDLLFATIEYPWQTPIAPLTTAFHDFFSNPYFAVSPFQVFDGGAEADWRKFRLVADHAPAGLETDGSRNRHLRGVAARGQAIFRLDIASPDEEKRGEWRAIARLTLGNEIPRDRAELRFSPFQCGRGIRPRGFTHSLREGAYRMSQWGRAIREGLSGPSEPSPSPPSEPRDV